MIEHLPPDHADFARFAFFSGWRRAEISGLVWAEVDLPGKLVRLPGSRSQNGQPRVLPLGKHLLPLVEKRKALGRDTLYVFSYIGEKRFKGQVLPIGDFRKRWARACNAAGCPEALMYDFRRTAVRNMVRAGVPERAAMARSGHKTRAMLDRYNIVSEQDLQESAKFEDGFEFPLDTNP